MYNADLIAQMLQRAGVQRLFGMPGGGSNADVIEAAGRFGLPFTLAQTENGSAFMASAQAEITGRPGACIATLGPGAASIMNGVANANLDCVPLIVITDCQSTTADDTIQHQTLRQGEMFAPLVKLTIKPRADEVPEAMEKVLETVCGNPPGPVHLDLSIEVTSARASNSFGGKGFGACISTAPIPVQVETVLQHSRRPLLLIGLGARSPHLSTAIRRLAETHNIPALLTYKAKGIVPDIHPWFAGILTNGALERDILERADAFIGIGLDPVELLPKSWSYPQPLISIAPWPMKQRQIPGAIEIAGNIARVLEQIESFLPAKCEWEASEIRHGAEVQRERMRIGSRGLPPCRVVEMAAQAFPGARATVDAGAHMFPVMSLWPADEPSGVLISNGLATMGFAVPAAIGASLLDPSRPVVAFTGDGGLLMCLGELRTAAREALPLRIVVFDDCALSLIRIKQVQRGYSTGHMDMGEVDWPSVGRGLGLPALEASSEMELGDCLSEASGHRGPVLIAAKVDAETYPETLRVLRG